MSGQAPRDARQELRRISLASVACVLLLLGGSIVWASTTEIAGAAIASGAIAVDGSVKSLQHPSGGVVAEILVENGDTVQSGDVLVRLDSSAAEQNLQALTATVNSLAISLARIEAELANGTSFEPPALVAGGPEAFDAETVIAMEQAILDAHRSSVAGQTSQLNSEISQFESQVSSYDAQADAAAEQISLVETQLNLLTLAAPSVAGANQQLELEKQIAALEGEQLSAESSMKSGNAAIAQRTSQLEQLGVALSLQLLSEQSQKSSQLSAAESERAVAQDLVESAEIVAPTAGVVFDMAVHTLGGVVAAGQTLMLLVPQDEDLIVNARILPNDIDQVAGAASVLLRLPTLNQRTTPELWGTITTLSPSVSVDAATGENYYAATIRIPADELEKLAPEVELVPGMQVEAFVQTGKRTVLSYLLKPLLDQFERAFREE